MPTPHAPTAVEIKKASDDIKAEGHDQAEPLMHAIQNTGNAWLRNILERSASPATLSTESAHFHALVLAAMTYGLNLGLRIGHARSG